MERMKKTKKIPHPVHPNILLYFFLKVQLLKFLGYKKELAMQVCIALIRKIT